MLKNGVKTIGGRVTRILKSIFAKFIYWFLCKAGSPIYSPSRALYDGERRCLYCGLAHGDLLEAEKAP
jgi:hypothetical protein